MGIFKNKKIIKDQQELIDSLYIERKALKATIERQAKAIESLLEELEKKEKCECKENKKVADKKPIKKTKTNETKGEVKNAKARRKQ